VTEDARDFISSLSRERAVIAFRFNLGGLFRVCFIIYFSGSDCPRSGPNLDKLK
jgi:hypothetical protein